MNKELQGLAWSVLPKEFKEEVITIYAATMRMVDKRESAEQIYVNKLSTLEGIFGFDNLTSDAEGEEMLIVSRKEIQQLVAANDIVILKAAGIDNIETIQAKTVNTILNRLFGSKCLPDKEYTTCVHASGTACKHYNHEEHHCSLRGECKFEPKSVSEISEEISDKVAKTIKAEFDKIESKPSEPKFKVGDKVSFAGSAYSVRNIINKGNGEFSYNLDCILPGEYPESNLTLCTNNFCQTEGQVVEHEGTQTSASTKAFTLDVEPNIFNTKPDNSDILNCALLKLEEASKAVREALTK